MDINPDFRTRLRERPGGGRERFELLQAGDYRMSIQLPELWFSVPSSFAALEDSDCWDVAIYTADGTTATPSTHPLIFQDALWRRYWVGGLQALGVPTEVVQTLYDFLVLGSERYRQMTTM